MNYIAGENGKRLSFFANFQLRFGKARKIMTESETI